MEVSTVLYFWKAASNFTLHSDAAHRRAGELRIHLNYLIDQEFDLSVFEARYRNDQTGAPAYDPAILLKIILYAYSRGIVSSREIAKCCRDHIIFIALATDTSLISRRLPIASPRLASKSVCCFAMCCSPAMRWGSLGASSLRLTAANYVERFQGVERDARGFGEKETEDGAGHSLSPHQTSRTRPKRYVILRLWSARVGS